MSYVEVNGQRAVSGQVVIPYLGLWYADLVLASAGDVSTPVTVTVGNLTMVGANVRSISYGGSRSVRIVGGAGGWRKTVPGKSYGSPAGVQRSVVLGDAAREVGESVSLASDGSVGTAYVRRGGPASRVLAFLSGGVWFMQADGKTRVGPRTSTIIVSHFDTVSVSGANGRIVIGTEDLAAWQPANTFTPPSIGKSQTISCVVHNINDGTIRTEILTDGAAVAA